jgi:hypothetical protein
MYSILFCVWRCCTRACVCNIPNKSNRIFIFMRSYIMPARSPATLLLIPKKLSSINIYARDTSLSPALASHSANIWLFNFSILRPGPKHSARCTTTAPFNRYFYSPGASTTGPQAKFCMAGSRKVRSYSGFLFFIPAWLPRAAKLGSTKIPFDSPSYLLWNKTSQNCYSTEILFFTQNFGESQINCACDCGFVSTKNSLSIISGYQHFPYRW